MLRVEVVGEKSVVAAHGRGLRAAPQRQRGEEESGRPAFEPLREGGRLVAGEQHPGPPEQGLRFAILQRELIHPDLEQAPLRPQAGSSAGGRRAASATPSRARSDRATARGRRALPGAEDVHVVDQRENAGVVCEFSESRFEDLGIVVLWLEVDPQNRTPVALGPLGQQRRLAEPCRRDDRDDRAVLRTAEPVEESGPNDGLPGRGRYERA